MQETFKYDLRKRKSKSANQIDQSIDSSTFSQNKENIYQVNETLDDEKIPNKLENTLETSNQNEPASHKLIMSKW